MYRADVINAAMGAERLTNEQVAAKARVTPKVVSAIRNGKTVRTDSLEKVIRALDLSPAEVFAPKSAEAETTGA